MQVLQEKTGQTKCDAPRTIDIHNPTLRFIHCWLAITLFSRADARIVKINELKLLYVVVRKVRVSPVVYMINQWLGVFLLV